MVRNLLIAIGQIAALALFVSSSLADQAQFGSEQEARAMLEKAVAALKENQAQALEKFRKGEGGFKDRDLYVFCYADGKVVAHGNDPTRVGLLTRDLKDTAGKLYGEEMLKVAEEGKVAEVGYMFPRPGPDTTPVSKVALVTKVGDQVCAVGYYKQD